MNGIKTDKLNHIKQNLIFLLGKLIRTKDPSKLQDPLTISSPPKLKKVLDTIDLTSLGIGSCVGTGMYLVAGMVAKNVAGPAVILSFIIAAITSLFSGVCYAEFGVRVPNTSGGAYAYSYATVGEFMAFIIGWNMVLEELIGTAACACALSACFDSLTNGAISNGTSYIIGNLWGKIQYHRPPDILGGVLTIFMGVVLITGVKKSVNFNNALNFLNFMVWVFILITGMFYVDIKNWTEHDGFMPYGWSGVLTGAATCFYAFIGFDIIGTTGEEALNPRKAIPKAIVYSLISILVAYVTSSAIITLMVPYDKIDPDAALVEAFGTVGAYKSKNIVAIGALAGLTVSMFGSMFSLPRLVYSMAKDGLIFRRFADIWNSTGTPALATAVFGLGASLAAMLFSLEILVEMMSIGTLLAYTLVSTCVLILRYQPHSSTLVDLLPESLRTPLAGTPLPGSPVRTEAKKIKTHSIDSDDSGRSGESTDCKQEDEYMISGDNAETKFYGAVPPLSKPKHPTERYLAFLQKHAPSLYPWMESGPCTEETGRNVMKLVGLLYGTVIIFDILLVYEIEKLEGHQPFAIVICLFLFICIISILVVMSRKPQNRKSLPFMAPGLPWVPAIAIWINIYLIFKLSFVALIRFVVWMAIGLAIYFFYGIKHSTVDREASIENFELKINCDIQESSSTETTALKPIAESKEELLPNGGYVSSNPYNPFRPT